MRRVVVLIIVIALLGTMAGCRPVRYQLTITSTEGGFVVSPGEGTYTYNRGTVVRVRARNCLGYWFSEWTGDVDTIGRLKSFVTTITMDGDYTIEATFKRSCAS